jgi:hypothetical protein
LSVFNLLLLFFFYASSILLPQPCAPSPFKLLLLSSFPSLLFSSFVLCHFCVATNLLLLLLLLQGEVSFKVFLVKTRCVGHRTPSRQEAEACSLKGVDLLGQVGMSTQV